MPSHPKTTAKLDKDAICMAIDELGRPFVEEVYVLQEIESTNSYLLGKTIMQGLATVCAAESQDTGRGRRGNNWQSAPNENVILSVSWGFSHWPDTLTGLGLSVAVVTAERLNKDHQIDVQIKWPNDLMVGGDKLAGILIDVSGVVGGACNVVIGLGLNVDQADLSTADTGYAWNDLHSLGVEMNRNRFIGQIVSDWVAMLQGFEKNGFAPLVKRWNALSCYSNRQIAVGDASGKIIGQMLGVDNSGALRVESADGEMHVFSDSNISVRLVA